MKRIDESIKSPLEDKLGNGFFAFHLACGIADLKNIEKSFVIALCGEWGQGKTSIINMMLTCLKYMEEKPYISYNEICEKEINKENPNEKYQYGLMRTKLLPLIALTVILFISTILLNIFYNNVIPNLFLYKNLFKMFFLFAILYFIFEKYLISAIEFLSKNVIIKKPLEKIFNYFFPNKNQHFIPIEFNPWNYCSSEKIMENFFHVLSDKIADNTTNCMPELSDLIKEYSKLTLNVDLSMIEKIILNKNSADIKKQIENILNKCNNKKIIVIIDDLDRLLPDEILTIFKTVKIIADFPNVIYILSFNKQKVIELLEKQYDFNACDYIKKIIQIEKDIPPVDDEVLKNDFIKNIEEVTGGALNDDTEQLEILYDFALGSNYIENIRDLNRFINCFSFVYSAYKKENINIGDLIAITAIEIFEPELYKYIRENKFVFCSTGVGMLKGDNATIYTNAPNNEQKSVKEFAEALGKFNNINILIILFPNLFKQFKNSGSFNYGFGTSTMNDFVPEIQEFIRLINNKPSKLFIEQEKYRRIRDLAFFDNYYRINFDKKTLNSKENEELLSVFNDAEKFRKKFEELYNKNPYKTSDFLKGWNSNYNADFRTKENTLNYIKNMISIKRRDIADFLDWEIGYPYLITNLIGCFNKENKKNKIIINDIFEIIKSQINYLQTNCYAFLFLLCGLYKFPKNNPSKLTQEERLVLDKCVKLINENITENAILCSKKGAKSIDYLFSYLNGKEFAKEFIDNLLKNGNEDKLLDFLMTANHTSVRYDGYGYIYELFKEKINADKKLKDRLLDIIYSDEYVPIMNNQKYVIKNGHLDEENHIAKAALKILVVDFGKFYGMSIKDDNGLEKVLASIEYTYKESSDNEIKFIKEISFDDRTNEFIEKLKELKEKISERPVLLKRYGGVLDKIYKNVIGDN